LPEEPSPSESENQPETDWRKPRLRDQGKNNFKAVEQCPFCNPELEPPSGNQFCPPEKDLDRPCCTKNRNTSPAGAVEARSRETGKPGCSSCQGQDQGSTGTTDRNRHNPKKAAASHNPLHWLPGISALKCQGLSTVWVTIAAALPAPAHVTWDPYLAPLAWVSYPVLNPLVGDATPPVPPPRLPSA
jgi:hypothetical protein